MQWQKLPLHEDWDYRYTVNLEGVLYNIRLYYSQRTSDWTMNIFTETGESVTGGVRIRSREPIRIISHKDLTGIFWLEPKSVSVDNENLHPSLINKYFNFYYGWGEVETPEVERVLVRNETSRVFHVTSSLYPIYNNDDILVNKVSGTAALIPQPYSDDDILTSRSFVGYSVSGTRYLTAETLTDNIGASRSFVGHSILETRYLTAETPTDEMSANRTILSVTPNVVLIRYNYDEDELGGVSRSLIEVKVE